MENHVHVTLRVETGRVAPDILSGRISSWIIEKFTLNQTYLQSILNSQFAVFAHGVQLWCHLIYIRPTEY
jgi:hypothetical protein